MNKENNSYSKNKKKNIVSFSDHFLGVVKDLGPVVLMAIPFVFVMILIVYEVVKLIG